MPALVIPIIAEKDYRALRKILRQYLPPRFESWAAECAKAVQDGRRLNAHLVEQPVSPQAFAAWLKEKNVPADMAQLNAFAWQEAISGQAPSG